MRMKLTQLSNIVFEDENKRRRIPDDSLVGADVNLEWKRVNVRTHSKCKRPRKSFNSPDLLVLLSHIIFSLAFSSFSLTSLFQSLSPFFHSYFIIYSVIRFQSLFRFSVCQVFSLSFLFPVNVCCWLIPFCNYVIKLFFFSYFFNSIRFLTLLHSLAILCFHSMADVTNPIWNLKAVFFIIFLVSYKTKWLTIRSYKSGPVNIWIVLDIKTYIFKTKITIN